MMRCNLVDLLHSGPIFLHHQLVDMAQHTSCLPYLVPEVIEFISILRIEFVRQMGIYHNTCTRFSMTKNDSSPDVGVYIQYALY